jgi:uncharacterized membrane protein (TIGR02234 family)
MTDRRARGELAVSVLLLVVGGVLGLAATSQPWAEVSGTDGLAEVTLVVTGRDLLPLNPAVALLTFAGVVAVAVLRSIGRFVTGTALAFAGVGMALATLGVAREPATHVDAWAFESGLTVSVIVTANPWVLWNGVAGLLIVAAGVLVAMRGSRWPTLGRRYERGSAGRQAADDSTSQHAWDALDRGQDPTAGP